MEQTRSRHFPYANGHLLPLLRRLPLHPRRCRTFHFLLNKMRCRKYLRFMLANDSSPLVVFPQEESNAPTLTLDEGERDRVRGYLRATYHRLPVLHRPPCECHSLRRRLDHCYLQSVLDEASFRSSVTSSSVAWMHPTLSSLVWLPWTISVGSRVLLRKILTLTRLVLLMHSTMI